jgi:hypothetical protein
MPEYPSSEFPWPFYFQELHLPKWSNCWHLLRIPDTWVDRYVDRVWGRIDHVGNIESEDADVFIIAAQQVLLEAIAQKEEFLRDEDWDRRPEDLQMIYDALLLGLRKTIEAAERTDVVFWTAGHPEDGEAVLEAIRRFQLGPQHVDYLEPPHRVQQKWDVRSKMNHQRKELRRCLAAIGPNKVLKRFIHDLKDRN